MAFSNDSALPNSTTVANNFSKAWERLSPFQLYSWMGTTLSVAVVASLLMFILVLTISTQKNLRTGSGVLILHLTLIELSMCAVHFPLNIALVYMTQTGQQLAIDCNITHLFYAVTVFVGNWSLFFLAFNRFVALIYPHVYSFWTSKSAITLIIALSWLFGFAMELPLYFGVGGTFGPLKLGGCGVVRFVQDNRYFASIVPFMYYIPIALMVTLYVCILLKAKLQTWRQVAASGAGGKYAPAPRARTTEYRLRITNMLFVSSVWYCLCYFPAPIISNSYTALLGKSNGYIFLWFRTLALCGYCGNPIIYFIMNVDYRRGALKCLHRVSHEEHPRHPSAGVSAQNKKRINATM